MTSPPSDPGQSPRRADPLAQRADRLLDALDFADAAEQRERENEAHLRTLLLALLGVADSFDRLLVGDDSTTALGTTRLIARQLDDALAGVGVVSIACLGTVVDPDRHEILETRPREGVDDDVIIEVVTRGWEWDGRLLRRPMVVVARNAQANTRKDTDS